MGITITTPGFVYRPSIRAGEPPCFLPEDVATNCNLVDITQVGDSFRRYIDTATGTVHDGAVYHAQALETNGK